MMVRVKFVILVSIFVICGWGVKCENKQGVEWTLYQRVQTLQIGLLKNNNLNKYLNLSEYSANDNKAFIDDQTKIKRSYNTEQCIKDLKTIREASNDEKSFWAIQSKR